MAKPPGLIARRGRLALGLLMMSASPIATPLPGPGGLLVFAGGLSLTLKSSARARRLFARSAKRYPRTGALLDRALRRASAKRRRARDEAALVD
ncbi:MAG TPA: hypothetical protein VF636_08325 [Sphingomonas sp.]|jgi:hypothetical protein